MMTPATTQTLAADYLRRGWAVIPLPAREKAPRLRGWQSMRLSETDLSSYFVGSANIGILTGEPSGGLADVDLDHSLAVEMADDYLPPTGSVFGRVSKPRSHRLYRCPGATTTKHQTRDRAMIVELRSTGCQTVAPGSTHPSGEPIQWVADDEPATIDADDLADAVARLADAVRLRAHDLADHWRERLALAEPDAPSVARPSKDGHKTAERLAYDELRQRIGGAA